MMRLWIGFALLSILFLEPGCCFHYQKRKCDPQEQAVYSRCQKILIEGLMSEPFWPRMHAAEGLTATGKSDVVLSFLPAMLLVEEDDRKRCGLARELIRAGDESKIDILTEILAEPESNGRIHAAESLFKVQRIGDPVLMFKCAKDNTNPRIQMWACAALIRAGHEKYLPVLRQFLSSRDPLEYALSVYILGQLGDRNEIYLTKTDMKQFSEPLHSFFYTAGFVYTNDSDAICKLQTYLNHEDKTIRALSAHTAGSALICSCQKRLIALLDDPVCDVRIRSAHALLSMK